MLVMQRSEERQGIYRGGERRVGAQVVGAVAPLLAPPWLNFCHSPLCFMTKQNKCAGGGFGWWKREDTGGKWKWMK
jgi:hypothetical protein